MAEIKTLILLLGGTTVIIVAILKWIGDNLSSRLKVYWENNGKVQIDELKGKIDRKNSDIHQILLNHSKQNEILSQKKIDCFEKFWLCIVELKEQNYGTEFLYSFLVDDELRKLLSSTDQSSINLRNDFLNKLVIDYPQIAEKIGKQKYEIEKLRPFIGDKLYSFYYLYSLFCMRSTYLLIGGVKRTQSEIWKMDKALVNMLKDNLAVDELTPILEQTFGSYQKVTSLLESKMIGLIQYSIYGDEVVENTYNQVEKIRTIFDRQKVEEQKAKHG